MKKLIEAFKANPSYDNARKVWSYDRSHPISVCFLSAEDIEVFNIAVKIAIHAH